MLAGDANDGDTCMPPGSCGVPSTNGEAVATAAAADGWRG